MKEDQVERGDQAMKEDQVERGDQAMKEKKLFDAITNVHENLIEEAANSKLKKSRPVWQKAAILAACAVLVLAGVLLVPGLLKENNQNGALLDVDRKSVV